MSSQGVRQDRGGPAHSELDETDIHDVLRNDRRRLVIERLQAVEDGSESVRELSERIAAEESGESPPPRNIRQSVYVSLHQTHLPKLDDLGIVEYDSDSKRVRLAECADEVAVYMEVVPQDGISWAEYYLGVGLLGLGLSVAVASGMPVLSGALGTALVALLFVVLVASSLYHVSKQEETVLDRLRE
jgi:predicted transcriptional regulator